MNTSLSHSRIAAFGVLILLGIQLILLFVKFESLSNIKFVVDAIYPMIWIILFVLIANDSHAEVSFRIPSFIIVAGYSLSLVSMIIRGYFLVIVEEPISGQWETIDIIMEVGYYVAIFIGFITLSNYFSKGSPLRILSYTIPLVTIALPIAVMYLFRSSNIQAIIEHIVIYGSTFCFMFSLSKILVTK